MPQPNRNCDAAKSNANGHVNHHTTYNGYTYGHGNHHTTSVSYAYSDDATSDAHAFGDPASADAKATAHAVSSSDAVSEWAKS